MIILVIIAGLYPLSVRAELYNHNGKVKNVVLPIFQYDEVDNMKACLIQAKQLGPSYYCE